jgi:SAM-dependent methyltransferase
MSASSEDFDYGNPEVFYRDFYGKMICGGGNGGGLGKKAVVSTHRYMERRFGAAHFSKVLELGGGNGEHLNYVLHGFDSYTLIDLRQAVLEDRHQKDPRVISIVADAERLPIDENSIDRVVVTCLLHHVDHPEIVLQEINRVLKNDGTATIFLSCDPGFVVRFLRKFTTERTAKKLGFSGYDLMNARDHRNHVGSLLLLIRHVFRHRQIQENWMPFRLPSWNLNGYLVLTISKGKNLLD